MAKKKTHGKKQRDRLKKRKAKEDATANLDGNGLFESVYSSVSSLIESMGVEGSVKESVTMDNSGRKLRVIMGGQKEMQELSKRMAEEQQIEQRLKLLSSQFNNLNHTVYKTYGQIHLKDEVNDLRASISELLFIGNGHVTNGYNTGCHIQKYPTKLSLILARHKQHYRVPGAPLCNKLVKIEDIVTLLHVKVRQEKEAVAMLGK
ncbi:hypothetical protein CTRI78_v010622 [Colletotrichum trifolii]|uniref:Uncharacterized protein n=1 Tax=Colletotrichum trifolii TaxID=5466 RepID=A0A4R8QRT1_COLTR|nr:hypothetical protein CTRI78_v010622 [Colletotrichum trifolii]